MESVRFKINCDVATVHFDDGTPTPIRGSAVNTVNTRSPRELRASAIELNDSSDLPVGGDETLRPPACEIVRHRNTIAKAAAATLVLACSAPATAQDLAGLVADAGIAPSVAAAYADLVYARENDGAA